MVFQNDFKFHITAFPMQCFLFASLLLDLCEAQGLEPSLKTSDTVNLALRHYSAVPSFCSVRICREAEITIGSQTSKTN